ncbi:MAG: AmmeMemoRadiSam system protein B [Pseudomonadota bacterium]|nr:AmmeMemoRadiSam system protein B [Pseudomonadota bacterium]
MNNSREMAVGGLFYPQVSSELKVLFEDWFANNKQEPPRDLIPRAMILPHAGYVYSGEVAATGYQLWSAVNNNKQLQNIKTVIVMGPAHRVAFSGIATVGFDSLKTPFGQLEVDIELRDELANKFDQVAISDYAHASEHSIEVHLPFIKNLLPSVKVLPLLNGQVTAEEVSEVLKSLWQREDVYFVISSDLSHFHSYFEAQAIDQETANMINQSSWKTLSGERACGYKGIQGLLALQPQTPLQIEQLQVINSGDTAGDRSSVVGYGAWAIYEGGKSI